MKKIMLLSLVLSRTLLPLSVLCHNDQISHEASAPSTPIDYDAWFASLTNEQQELMYSSLSHASTEDRKHERLLKNRVLLLTFFAPLITYLVRHSDIGLRELLARGINSLHNSLPVKNILKSFCSKSNFDSIDCCLAATIPLDFLALREIYYDIRYCFKVFRGAMKSPLIAKDGKALEETSIDLGKDNQKCIAWFSALEANVKPGLYRVVHCDYYRAIKKCSALGSTFYVLLFIGAIYSANAEGLGYQYSIAQISLIPLIHEILRFFCLNE